MDNLEQALLESENSLMLLSDEELITPINDILIINPETRLIEVPDTELLLGVFGENLVEKKYFKCPRIVLNNIDLYECFIFINYVSANGRIGSIQSENVELDETEQYILFDWDLTSNVFDKNKDSTIYFSVSAKQYLEDSEPVFATRKAQGKMYETINGTEYITQEHADIILQILAGMKTKVDLPKDEDGNLLVPEEGQTLLFKEDGTTYYGTPSSGGGTSFSGSAKDVKYDDTETKLGAENVQDAIGKLSEDITIEVEYDFMLLHESDGANSSYLDVGVDVEVGDVLKCVTPRVDGKNLDDRIDIYTSVDGVDKYQSLEFPIIKDVFGETPITEVELIVEITEEVTSIRVYENTTVYKRKEITIGKKVSSIETELIKVQKEKVDKKDIPTKTSQLKNDSNFITTENINVCVKLTFENGLYVADKTYEEIVEFYNNGYSPYVVLDNNVFRLYKVNESSFEFAYCQVGTVEVMIYKVIITNNNINIVQSSTEILKEISKQSHWRFEKVDSIPVNDASYNVIYLVQRFDEDNHVKGNIYDEYIFLEDGNRYELIGSTDIDLSNVYQKSETYSKEEVNALVKAVSDAVIALQSKVPTKTSQLIDDVGFGKVKKVNGFDPDENGNVNIPSGSSWNDLTDRPFYSFEGDETVFDDTVHFPTSKSKFYYEEPFPFDLVVGDTYKVIWDGEEYECVSFSKIVPWGGSYLPALFLGNISKSKFEGMELVDSGEPFLFEYVTNVMDKSGYIHGSQGDVDISIKVVSKTERVVPLLAKYLPDGVPFLTGDYSKVLPETQFSVSSDDLSYYFEDNVSLVENELYTVVLDGTTYECVGQLFEQEDSKAIAIGNLSNFGFDDNGLPFLIVSLQGFCLFGLMSMELGLDHTIEIYGWKVEKRKLPEELLPDSILELKTKIENLIDGEEVAY